MSEEDQATEPALRLLPSRMFAPWLASTGASLGFTTYQAGKVFLVGTHPGTGALSVYERSFPRCMGLAYDPTRRRLWLSSLFQVWRFENFLDPGQWSEEYDALFVPLEGRTTGDIDIHDIVPRADPAPPVFVVTRFNCLATLAPKASFAPIWTPPFIDRIAAEDRCHLNGLAVQDGRLTHVTCVAESNTAGGWRDQRADGGRVIDIATGQAVVEGLSMPHSPRWHQGTLYGIQSGSGEFGRFDLDGGRFEPLCFLPGFARGLCFLGNHAVIGVSRPRPDRTFSGLALDTRLQEARLEPRCQVAVVNLTTGDVEHSLEIEGAVQELYDVVALPGVRRPKILGFQAPDIRFTVRPDPLDADLAPELGAPSPFPSPDA